MRKVRASLFYAGLVGAVLVASAANAAATLEAKYLFQGNLNSSVAGAPALIATDPTSTSGFITDNVNGTNTTVYHVGGMNDNASQGGLTFDATGLLTSGSYSVALTFEFLERNNAWRRIIDTSDRQADRGFYVDPNNQLNVFPTNTVTGTFANDVYRNVVLTVTAGTGGAQSTVAAYIDGGMSLSTVTNVMDLSSDNLINIFLDNIEGGGQGEWSQANIAALSFYDGVLSGDEIRAINGDPLAPPPSTSDVPEPASWAMFIAGFGLTGAAMRRKKAIVRFI